MMKVKMLKVKMLAMDVDGTLTDGKIYMSAQGELFKAFDIKDGYGIHDLLPKAGITPVIITGRDSLIVTNRCRELGIRHIYQGVADKAAELIGVAGEFGLEPDGAGIYQQIAYMGDDLNDLPCMKLCGLVGCPADAVEEVKRGAGFVSSKPSGCGAVREFIQWILQKGQE